MCEHKESKCIDTRAIEGGRKRRYVCNNCGERWTTVELKLNNKPQYRKGFTAVDGIIEQLSITKEQALAIKQLLKSFGGKI